MSCHDGVGLPRSLEKAPRVPGLHPAGSVTVSSFVCSSIGGFRAAITAGGG